MKATDTFQENKADKFNIIDTIRDSSAAVKTGIVALAAAGIMSMTSCASTREVTPGRAAQGGMKCGWRVR